MQPPRPPAPNAAATRAAINAAMAPGGGTLADLMAPDGDPVKAAAKVSKARSILVADYPWFGTLATRLQVKAAPFIGTLATDGTRLIYAPAFVNKQPMPELLGGIAHEVLHCGLLHPFRFANRDHGEWNISCDYAINGILIAAGFKLPKGSLHEPKYDGLSAEQIYARRAAEAAANPPPPPPPPGGEGEEQGEEGEPGTEPDDNDEPGGSEAVPQPGDDEPAEEDGDQGDEEPDGDEPEPTEEPGEEDAEEDAEEDGPDGEEPGAPTDPKPNAPVRPGRVQEPEDATGRMLPAPPKNATPGEPGDGEEQAPGTGDGPPMDEADWMVATAQATMTANKAGKSPAGAVRAAEAVREPVTDWREVLRRFIDQATSRDQSWTTPNRRFIAGGLYLPGNTPTDAPRLGVLVDTSGSIDRDCLNQFASELDGIMRDVRPEAVDVVYCDAAVAGVQEFTPDGGPLALTPAGGGGTDMEPGFQWFDRRADEGLPVCAVVCFTDLDFWSIPPEPLGYPVLWVCYPWVNQTGPYGETVRLSA